MGPAPLSPPTPDDEVGAKAEGERVLQVGIRARGTPSPGADRDGQALRRVSSIPGQVVWGDGAGLSRTEGPSPLQAP